MNLFHRRPVCVFGAALLICGYALIYLPYEAKLALLIASACLLPLPIIRCLRPLLGKAILPLTALLLAALALLLAVDLPTRRILEQSRDDGNVLEFRILTIQNSDVGIYTADNVTVDGSSLPLVKLLVTDAVGLAVGDRVRAVGSLSVIEGDSALYYRDEGCHAAFEVTELYFADPDPDDPGARLTDLSQRFIARIRETGGEGAGALLSALLLGETDYLTDRTALHFRRLGISHILAVSGMHLVTLSLALTALFRRMRFPRSAIAAINIGFMLFYTLLTGAPPSILRAFVMALVMQLAFFLGRKSDTLSSLFFSGIVLFFMNPFILFSISFSLSFASTFGIVVGFIAVRRLPLCERIADRPRTLLVTPIVSTLAATLFTMPITLLSFGQIPILSLPANLLFGLPFQVLLCISAVALILGPLPFVTAIVGFLSHALLRAVSALASLPFAVADAAHPAIISASLLLAVSATVLLLLPRVSGRTVRRTLLSTGALLLILLPIFAHPHSGARKLSLTTDTESGEFFVLETGIGRAVIGCSDGGYDGVSSVAAALHRDAVTELSLYVPSHYGRRSLSELRALCRSYLVRRVALPSPSDSGEEKYFSQILAYLHTEGIPYTVFSPTETQQIGNFKLAVSPRAASGSYLLMLFAGDDRIVYFSGSAADGVSGEAIAKTGAATAILGSSGITEAQRIRIEPSQSLDCLILCSPLHDPGETSESVVSCTGLYEIKYKPGDN